MLGKTIFVATYFIAIINKNCWCYWKTYPKYNNLSNSTVKTLIQFSIVSHLKYCNAVQCSLPTYLHSFLLESICHTVAKAVL